MPGTAKPFASGRSANSRLIAAAGTWPSIGVAADLGGMAGSELGGNAEPLLDRTELAGVAHVDLEPGCPDVLDPAVAASATRVLAHDHLGRARPRSALGR